MNTHPDGRFRIGASSLVPYDPQLTVDQRHARRTRVALESEPIIRAWCDLHGVSFWITSNDSGHPHAVSFRFKVQLETDAAVAIWVPGVARAESRTTSKAMTRTRKRRWRRRHGRFTRPDTEYAHLHDWHHLLNFLERWLARIPHDRRRPHPGGPRQPR